MFGKIRPFIFKFDPETAHNLAIQALKFNLMPRNQKQNFKHIETEIFKEFFQSFSQSAEITLHIENIYGQNTHHIIESCFKSMAISLRNAIQLDFRNLENVPSTKGTLTGNR